MSSDNNTATVSATKQFDRRLLDQAPATLDVIDLGEGLKLVGERKVEFTREFATSILELTEFSADRPLVNEWVMTLLQAMRRGTFLGEQVQIVTCKMGGKEYRMNGQHTCFPAGTRIKMADGSTKPIEKINLLDSVLSAEGNIRRVRQCHVLEHAGKMATIKLWGHAVLKCTPDHKLLTKRGYVPAEKLTTEDWVIQPRYAPVANAIVLTSNHVAAVKAASKAKHMAGPASSFAKHGDNHKNVPDVIRLDAPFGRLIGLYLAEGCTVKSRGTERIVWTFGSDEANTLVAETVALAESIGLAAKAKATDHNSINVTGFGIMWAEMFRSFCGHKARGKRLHPDLLSGPNPFLESVFWGWMDGDGCTRGNGGTHRCGATISHELALQMFDIANHLGLAPSLSNERGTNFPVWKVQVAVKEPGARHQGLPQVEQRNTWRRVRGVAYEEFDGTVYNIGVEGDNSYVAEGLGVSNCWARFEMDDKYKCFVKHMRYEAASENDMRRLYASIDRGRPRSTNNVVQSYLFDTTEWKGTSKRTISKLGEGLMFWLFEKRNKRDQRDGDDRSYLLMTDHYDLARIIGGFLDERKDYACKHIRRRPVVAAMFATFSKNVQRSIEFWTAVRDGTNFGSKNDPRLLLRNVLAETVILASVDRKSMSPEQMYRACIHAWNSFQAGDQPKRLTAPAEL